jgi:hypothetical protein
MADESSATAGERLSRDLRHIREERGISVDEIHRETQIAETLIESFEAGRLYDHPTYNRVYLRSFVKAYADAVHISRETALECLDAALDGTYDGALASTYLTDAPDSDRASGHDPSDHTDPEAPSTPPEDLTAPPDAPTAGGPEGRGGIVGPPRAVGEDPPPEADPDAPDAPVEESPPPRRADRPDASSPDEEASDAAPSDAAETASASPDSEVAPTDESGPTGASPPQEEPAASSPIDEPPDSDATSDSGDEEASDEGTAPEDDGPAWLGEGSGADEGIEADHADGPSPGPERPPGSAADASLGAGQSGVVGEPVERGSGPTGGASAPGKGREAPSRVPVGDRSAVSDWLDALPGGRPQLVVTGAGIAVVLLVLVGLGLAYFSSGETDPAPPTAAASGDTTRAAAPSDTAASAPRRPPANVRLGSTVHLTVLARTNVSALRIQRDEDLRRPYWIREGEADVFPFTERVQIENGLSDVRLFVEGYPYPVAPEDTVGGLELTRAGLQSFVDTLRGAPASLSVSPDTIPIGAPTP